MMLIIFIVLLHLPYFAIAFQRPFFHLEASKFSSFTKIYSSKKSNDEDSIKGMQLDVSKLSKEEQDRIAFIQKLTLEANQFARDAGFPVDEDEDIDSVEIRKIAVGDTRWSGQSNVEEEFISKGNPVDIINRPFLYLGDMLAIFTFAAVGRGNHGENLGIWPIIETAAPFFIAWTILSSFLGAYTRNATSKQGLQAVLGIIPAWMVSIPSALVIRGYIKDYIPPTPFIIASMIATFVLISLWRCLYIAAVGETTDEQYRKAGFLEVFKMVSTLVRRW